MGGKFALVGILIGVAMLTLGLALGDFGEVTQIGIHICFECMGLG